MLRSMCPRFVDFMVAVAQVVERQVVVLDVGGSSPLGHPSFFLNFFRDSSPGMSHPVTRIGFVRLRERKPVRCQRILSG